MGDTKGAFYAKIGTIKNRKGKDLTEAEEIKKRLQKNYTKKGLNDLDNHSGMVSRLKPDILECEVKWALGIITTNKVSGGNGIQAELFHTKEDFSGGSDGKESACNAGDLG